MPVEKHTAVPKPGSHAAREMPCALVQVDRHEKIQPPLLRTQRDLSTMLSWRSACNAAPMDLSQGRDR